VKIKDLKGCEQQADKFRSSYYFQYVEYFIDNYKSKLLTHDKFKSLSESSYIDDFINLMLIKDFNNHEITTITQNIPNYFYEIFDNFHKNKRINCKNKFNIL